MTAHSLLDAFATLPDHAVVSVQVGWLREQVEAGETAAMMQVDYTLREVGVMLGVSKETIRAACVRGEFPGAYKRANREWRIPPAAVRAYMDGERERYEQGQNGHESAALGGKRSGGTA